MAQINRSSDKPWMGKGQDKPWMPKKDPDNYRNNMKRFDGKFYQKMTWRNLRDYYIRHHPLCQECERKGRIEPGYCVDHIIPIKLGGSRMDIDNLQTLCRLCHTRKTNKEIAEEKNKFKKQR